MIYASELAAKALGLAPEGAAHDGPDCICAMCQRPIHPGDISVQKELPRTFVDFGHLAPSDFLCGFCSVTTHQDVMRDLQRCVITSQGIYNLNTDAARAWFWMTPPEPPFAVVINHSTMAAFHYFWRTPVTLDRAFVQMNVDGVLYQIRRDRVLKALDYAKVILDRAPVLEKRKSIMKSPFVVLSRDPTKKARGNNGHVAKDAILLAQTYPDCKEAVAFLQTMTPGELVALSPFLKQTPSDPIQPELITRITQ